MFNVHLVSLIIDPSLSCPISTRLLYIVGSNISCLWSPSEIEIRNRIDDEFSEFTWFNEETCTSGKMLTAPCSKSDIESSVSIPSILWHFLFPVKWKRARTKKNRNVTYSCDPMTTNTCRNQKKKFPGWTNTEICFLFLFLPMSMRQSLWRLILWQLFKIGNKH